MAQSKGDNLEALLTELGIRLGRSTDVEVYGYCPGHERMLGREDHRPTTWSVNRSTGHHYCFSCLWGGTLLELIIDQRGGGLWNALALMRRYDVDPTRLDELPATYHNRSPRTKPYEVLDEEELDQFVLPPAAQLRKRKIAKDSAIHYEVLWDDDDALWICPIRLIGGALLGWQAKSPKWFDNYPEGVSKSQTLYGIDKFEFGDTAILVESPLDVARIHSAGFGGAVSSFGVSISEDQMRLLLSVTNEVILALDNDASGRAMTHTLITGEHPKRPRVAWGAKFSMSVFNYKNMDGKDPGELSDAEIEWAIDNALHSSEWN